MVDPAISATANTHSGYRWLKRVYGYQRKAEVDDDLLEQAKCEVNEAWESSLPVKAYRVHGAPRIHQETDMILIMKNRNIVTVMPADDKEYELIDEGTWAETYSNYHLG